MLKELARAKINLTLDISGVRADGYHEVSMILQTIELADELELEKISGGIRFAMDATKIIGGEKIPCDEKNLAWQAAIEFQKFCGKNFGVSISLKKKIPAAAGLAGGSADAAAVIRGMNRLYETNLNENELCTIGSRVGSDVPFCIIGGTCLAEGRGQSRKEKFQRLGLTKLTTKIPRRFTRRTQKLFRSWQAEIIMRHSKIFPMSSKEFR